MAESSRKTDEERTAQVAFEGSAVDPLEDITRILIKIESFDHFGNDFGVGDTITPFDGIAVDDEDWRASDLYACLVAADFKRTFPAPGNAQREGFMIKDKADFESWIEQALAKYAPPGVFPEQEVGECGIAIEDFVPHVNHGSRVLAKRAEQDDNESAQGDTIVRLDDGRAVVGFGSVGTVIGFVRKYGYDTFSTKDHGLNLEVERALVARWFERKRAKPISISHPVWALLPPSALETYKMLVPQAPA
jgi:hypothetical protein